MAHDSFRLPCPSGCLSSEDSCIEFDVPDSHFEDPDAGDEIVSIRPCPYAKCKIPSEAKNVMVRPLNEDLKCRQWNSEGVS